MTEKLYYRDCHLAQFRASVTGCTPTEKGYLVTLDATAFYPEGGGQACDLGTLGGVRVLDVQERDGVILHLCDGALQVGDQVDGAIDDARRFDLMQQHTGEHIVSGIIHRRFGYHNTGFHMGADVTTIDFDGIIPVEALAEIEAEANGALWKNLPVRCWYPSPEELPTVSYRTKRALPWPVRIVEIPGYDCCACCGVHTAATGEVGLIKLFSAVGFRGGTRMELACGRRALDMLNLAFAQNTQVSQAFSAKWTETGAAAAKMNEALAAEKYRAIGLQRRLIAGIAQRYDNCGNVVHFEPGLDAGLLRELADAIAQRCGGIAAVFSGDDRTGYGFCILARTGDLRPLGKAMTQSLSGRGGGRADAQQGRVNTSRTQIETFFANWN